MEPIAAPVAPVYDQRLIARLAAGATTRQIVVARDVLGASGGTIAGQFPGSRVVVIADERTWHAAGNAVQRSLTGAGVATSPPIVLGANPPPRPDTRIVGDLRAAIATAGDDVIPVAVGSGTINDLVKRAAFELDLPYAAVATAASMDGYTASGAALVHDGVKQTFPCPAPRLVLADLDVLAAAPAVLTAAGYGDLLGKITAGADWLVADALGIEPLDPVVWSVVQDPLRGVVSRPDAIARGDAAAIEALVNGLLATGLAIQRAGSTRPASGSEHQFSHLWEMRGLEIGGIPVSHGFKVGLGTLVSAALYERLLEVDVPSLDVEAIIADRRSAAEIERAIEDAHAHPFIVDLARREMAAKRLSDEELRVRLTRVRVVWPDLASRLRAHLVPAVVLRDWLARAGCPTTPEAVGLTRTQLRESYAAAAHVRRRYTVFDLVEEIGVADELVDGLFAPGGFWAVT